MKVFSGKQFISYLICTEYLSWAKESVAKMDFFIQKSGCFVFLYEDECVLGILINVNLHFLDFDFKLKFT